MTAYICFSFHHLVFKLSKWYLSIVFHVQLKIHVLPSTLTFVLMHGTEMIANFIPSNRSKELCSTCISNFRKWFFEVKLQFSIRFLLDAELNLKILSQSDVWSWNDSQFYTFKSEQRVMLHLYIKFLKMIFWSQITVFNSFCTECWTQFENMNWIWCMELEW